ncbi:MAG TPA: hypothetical protein VH678_06635 [Xanthobacteraceae bacterium]|jgi:hypothetical protein
MTEVGTNEEHRVDAREKNIYRRWIIAYALFQAIALAGVITVVSIFQEQNPNSASAEPTTVTVHAQAQ